MKVQSLFIFTRSRYVSKYKVRRAVEEDNDDLVELINTHSSLLQEFYGDFYIAELLTIFSECGRQIIVAEHKEEAVAVMCLNEAINYDLLNQNFELRPFYGLKKTHDDDELTSIASRVHETE